MRLDTTNTNGCWDGKDWSPQRRCRTCWSVRESNAPQYENNRMCHNTNQTALLRREGPVSAEPLLHLLLER